MIGTTADVDLFRFTTTATNTYQITVSVPQFGNLDSQLVLYMLRGKGFGSEYLEQVMVVDPSIPQSAPFSGLGATIKGQLPAGRYALAVRSHGGYGDIGGYSLTVSIPSSGAYYDLGGSGVFYATLATEQVTSTPEKMSTTTTVTKSSSGGADQGSPKSSSPLVVQGNGGLKKSRKKAEHESRDQLFEAWPTQLERAI